MRIISKFHDYYDSVLKQGSDTSIVYVRESTPIVVSKYDHDKLPYVTNAYSRYLPRTTDWESCLMYLGFCGKVYPVLKYSYKTNVPEDKVPDHFCYSMAEVEAFNTQYGITLRKEKEWHWRGSRSFDPSSEKSLIRFFNQTDFGSLVNVFADKNVPIFSYKEAFITRDKILELNCSLKDIQFFRQKDSFTCFQDISMYVSGVLNSQENKMVSISDKDKIHKHGFDNWSFRTKGKNSKD